MENGITHAGTFFELGNLLTYQNMLVIIGAWFIIETTKKMGGGFHKTTWGKRLLPLLPVIICEIMVWATVKWQPESTPGEKILLGLVLGACTANAHTIFKRFGLTDYIPVLGEKGGDDGGSEEKEDA